MNRFRTCVMRSRWGIAGVLLALGSLAVTSCSDDSSSPRDASQPPDTSQPPDARRPADARQPPDASQPPDGGQAADGGTDAALAASCPPAMDSLEPNDTAGAAPTVAPSYVSDNPGWVHGGWSVQACLGSANQDWYRIEASQLRFDLDKSFEGTAYMRLRTIIDGTGVCRGSEGCGTVYLPEIPENTVNVDVYRASTMELVTTSRDEAGVVQIDTGGEAFTGDLLIAVSGPAEALYSYHLSIFIDVQGSEDECEC